MSNAQVVTRGSIHPQSFPDSLHPQSFPDSSHPQSFPDSSHPQSFPESSHPQLFPDSLHPQSFPDFVRQLSSNRNTIILERKMERHKIIYQNNNKGSILQWNIAGHLIQICHFLNNIKTITNTRFGSK